MNNVDDILTLWRTYKLKVPTYGAIILNTKMDKVLLVQVVKYFYVKGTVKVKRKGVYAEA